MKKILIIYSGRKIQIIDAINYLKNIYSDIELSLLLNEKFKNNNEDFKMNGITDFYFYSESEFFIYDKFLKSNVFVEELKILEFDIVLIVYNHSHLGGKYYEDVEKIAGIIPHKILAGYWLNGEYKIFNNEFIEYKELELRNYYIREKNAIEEIAEFTGENFDIVSEKIKKSEIDGFNRWNRLKSKDENNIINFYLNADFYIYQLMRSNDFNGGRTEYIPLIEKYLEKSDNIIDYGCGIGQIAITLSEKGYKTNVADLNSKMFEFVQFRIKKRKLSINAFSLNGKKENINNQFNKIICLDVIEHVVEPLRFLKNLYSILADNGKLILRIPFDEICQATGEEVPLHFNYINKNNFIELFNKSGFNVYKKKSDLFVLSKN